MNRCLGCGALLQTTDPKQIGYIEKINLEKNVDHPYCYRCYQIIHHNLKYETSYENSSYFAMLKKLVGQKFLAILMVDVMDLLGGFIPISAYLGSNPVILIVNKVDILPKKFPLNMFDPLLERLIKNSKLNIKKVLYGSIKKTAFVKEILMNITSYHQDCYLFGHASVGKSTLMNQLGILLGHITNDVITTSRQFNTTLDLIKWPLDEKHYLIDTPGVVNIHHYGYYLTPESLNLLIPKTYLKPRTYQIFTKQSFLIGSLCQIDCIVQSPCSISFYISNDLYIHRCKTSNVKKIKEAHPNELLVPPFTQKEKQRLKPEKIILYEIDEKAKIFICGLGFLILTGQTIQIKIRIPKVIEIEMI